ncbi:LAETG motif-containing sortase-dependent surface protein [Streptomyces sp. CA-111067]|uniref:LAETG motif-containing sortase-dependent surface protein n=1 Tax=Streptomyces sp. CA-111067 TaxID=3240046 RepID=UPI003D958C8C
MAALVGAGVFAVPASAHDVGWNVTCNSVSVHLTNYNGGVTNSVSVSVDGGAVLASEAAFGASYDYSGALPDHTGPITVHLVVKAGDSSQYNRDETKTAAPCETTPPTTPPTTPASPPPSTGATTPAAPTTAPPTTSAPAAPVVSTSATSSAPAVAATASGGSDLAETGSSSATPMIAGIAAAVVVVGGGLVFVGRRRRSASHR